MTAADDLLSVFAAHANTVTDHGAEPLPERVVAWEREAHAEALAVGYAVLHRRADGSLAAGSIRNHPELMAECHEQGCTVVALVPLAPQGGAE